MKKYFLIIGACLLSTALFAQTVSETEEQMIEVVTSSNHAPSADSELVQDGSVM